MKKLLLSLAALLACTATPLSAAAQPTVGDLTSVDAKQSAITVSIDGKPRTWRVRMDTAITVDGKKAAFANLTPKMVVKVTASDPSVASKIDATSMGDVPSPNASKVPLGPDGQPLTGPELRARIFGVKIMPNGDGEGAEDPAASFKDSKWRTSDGRIITLHANGSADTGAVGNQGKWKAINAQNLEWTLDARAKAASKVAIDATGNTATWKDDFGFAKTAKRIGAK